METSGNKLKFFLSHASEDQPDFVRPLAEALSQEFDVWYSEYELTLGDRLRAKIDAGLSACDYGIVVLSDSFFAKRWPKEELDGLFSRETDARKVILPIWKDLSEEKVKGFSPMLASRLGIDAALGIPRIMHEIKRSVGLIDRIKSIDDVSWKTRILNLDTELQHAAREKEYFNSDEARKQFLDQRSQVLDLLIHMVQELSSQVSTLRFTTHRYENYVVIDGPKRLFLVVSFQLKFCNSLDEAYVELRIGRDTTDNHGFGKQKHVDLKKWRLLPRFNSALKLYWADNKRVFDQPESISRFIMEEFTKEITGT